MELYPLERLSADLTELGWQRQAEKLVSAYRIILNF